MAIALGPRGASTLLAATSAVVVSVAACGGSQSNPTCPSPAPEPSAPAAVAEPSTSYAAVFDLVAREVEAHHVFALDRRAFWDAHKDELRRATANAKTREAALVALRHTQASLGDAHCWLRPPTDARPVDLKLGLDVHAALVDGKPVVRVSKVKDPALEEAISVGDVVVAVDGVAMNAWLEAHPFESNDLNPVTRLQDTAEAAFVQTPPWSLVKENDTRVVSFSRGDRAFDKTLVFRQPHRYEKKDATVDLDDSPEMGKVGCSKRTPEPYAGYTLDRIGANVCVYRAKVAGKPPIVRFVSFMYDLSDGPDASLRAIKADHELLARSLVKDERVILDLHENRGGMNPFVFVSWFANKPWAHPTVHVRVAKAFSDDDARRFLWGDDDLVARYGALRSTGEPELTYPFLCKRPPCEGVGPRRAELVTTKPVAVITGPRCASSCDQFSALWSEFGLGPIVGKQPAHGFTSARHSFPIEAPDHRDMGRFSIALSWQGFAGRPSLEGRPIELGWEAPETFEARTSWLDDAVVQATKLLAAKR